MFKEVSEICSPSLTFYCEPIVCTVQTICCLDAIAITKGALNNHRDSVAQTKYSFYSKFCDLCVTQMARLD